MGIVTNIRINMTMTFDLSVIDQIVLYRRKRGDKKKWIIVNSCILNTPFGVDVSAISRATRLCWMLGNAGNDMKRST